MLVLFCYFPLVATANERILGRKTLDLPNKMVSAAFPVAWPLPTLTITLFHRDVLRPQTAQGQASIPHHHSKSCSDHSLLGTQISDVIFQSCWAAKAVIDFHNVHKSLQMKVMRPSLDKNLGQASISPCSVNHLRRVEMRPQCSAFKETQHKTVLITWIPANETVAIKGDYLCGNSGGGGQRNEEGNV